MTRVLSQATGAPGAPDLSALGRGLRVGRVMCLCLFLLVAGFALVHHSQQGTSNAAFVRIHLAEIPRAQALTAIEDTLQPGPFVKPDRARAINAAVAFSEAPLVPARSFRLAAGGESHARARDCLASALWYEAGDDNAGQRSVAQVVLNRVMHPAFPKTVCGVVYQGAERATGCQFTFTCDGSMHRRSPSLPAWARAQANAVKALEGRVDPTVGLSTHYHTDWVAPRWSGSLTKIARVGTHLFFRFPGAWGSLGAFRNPSGGAEPQIAKLAALSKAHDTADALPDIAGGASLTAVLPSTNRQLMGNRVSASGGGRFALQLNMQAAWAGYARVAQAVCEAHDRCVVMGWAPDAVPSGMAAFDARRGSALFVYRKSGSEKAQALWDCRQFLRPKAQCLPGTAPKGPV